MKKILGVVLASALVAGAFAQVSAGVEFRAGLDVADVKINKSGDPTQSYLKQDSKDDTHIGVSAAGKNVTATAEFNVDLDTMTLGVGDVFATFHVGGFNFTAGKLGSRFTNRMRQSVGRIVNVSIAEPAKYGIAIKGNVGNDADNMTDGSNLAMIGDYTFAIGDAKLLTKAAIFSKDPGIPFLKSGYGFEAAYQSKLFTVDAVVKVRQAYTAVTGLYVYVAPVKMLSVSAGGTLAWDNSAATENFAFGVDLRARVVPIDALAVTLMGNYSNNAAKDSGGNTTNKDGIYVMLNGTYMLNDMFDLFCEAGYFDADVKGETNNNIKFQVGTTVKPVEHVTISASARGILPLESSTEVFQIQVPVALKVAF